MLTQTVAYFKHGLGNLIMMTPALQAMASMDPSGKIDICMDSKWKDARRQSYDTFFEEWDLVQKVINHPRQNLRKYKTWFWTGHAEHSDALKIFMDKSSLQSNTPDWRGRHIHEAYWYMEIANKYGYRGPTPKQYVPIAKKPLLGKKRKPLIGICDGTFASKMLIIKKYPYFSELVETLQSYYNATIVKIGYQEELKNVPANIDYVNKLSFTETAKVISQLDLLITTDTANMHVGDALDIPMIALFGGTLISKNGALSKKAVNLAKGLHCQPCQKTEAFYNCEHYNCINQLTVGDVMDEVRRILK